MTICMRYVSQTGQRATPTGRITCVARHLYPTRPRFRVHSTVAPRECGIGQCIPCWRAARCSWSRSRYPVFARCCWAIIRVFHTIAGGTEHAVVMRLDAVFPILQRLVHADFAAVEIGFYAHCWSCFSELDVGWSEPFLGQNELQESQTGADVTLSDIRLAVERL